jgi:hypothetical protein
VNEFEPVKTEKYHLQVESRKLPCGRIQDNGSKFDLLYDTIKVNRKIKFVFHHLPSKK